MIEQSIPMHHFILSGVRAIISPKRYIVLLAYFRLNSPFQADSLGRSDYDVEICGMVGGTAKRWPIICPERCRQHKLNRRHHGIHFHLCPVPAHQFSFKG